MTGQLAGKLGDSEEWLRKARMYQRRRDRASSFECLSNAVSIDQNNLEALALLGGAYLDGRGITRNESQGLMLVREAATRGNAEGQFCLGLCYRDGEAGLPRDYAQAVVWFKRAAEQGHESSKWELALLLYHGTDGVKGAQEGVEDRLEAAKWFEQLATNGSRDAASRLSNMYRDGKGVTKSAKKDRYWRERAAEFVRQEGHRHKACMEVYSIWFARWRLGEKHDIGQSDRIVDCLTKLAHEGEVEAMVSLGYAYEDGLGIYKDLDISAEWYLKAAVLGNVIAQVRLAWMAYDEAYSGSKKADAHRWFECAAQAGHELAKEQLKHM